MDFIKNAVGGDNQNNDQNQQGSGSGEGKKEGGFLSGIGEKLNGAAGGGKEVSSLLGTDFPDLEL